MAFEIHLPQRVRLRVFEADIWCGGAAGFSADAAMAAQDAVDRARGEDDAAVAAQDVGDLARAPDGMVIAHGEDARFLRLRGALGAVLRTTGALVHVIAGQALVDGLAADAETARQCADVGAGLAGEGIVVSNRNETRRRAEDSMFNTARRANTVSFLFEAAITSSMRCSFTVRVLQGMGFSVSWDGGSVTYVFAHRYLCV